MQRKHWLQKKSTKDAKMVKKALQEAGLILPHQLFAKSPVVKRGRTLFLVEAPRYFTEYSFHKQKLVLHRASMKAYEAALKKKGHTVTYIPHTKYKTLATALKKSVHNTYITLIQSTFHTKNS